MSIRYTKEHEYVRLEGDTAIVGITDFAQAQLGDVVFVELPKIGTKLEKGAEAAVVESVKAASEIFAPLSGEVVEINDLLSEAPGTVNEDPGGKGWFLKLKVNNTSELESLMDEAAYQGFLQSIA
jgi:glycine cleavage system H protein